MSRFKNILILFLTILISISSLSLTGCFGLIFDDSLFVAKEQMEFTLDAIESGDKQKIKRLFASNALAEIDDIDTQIDELISYYTATHKSFDGLLGIDSYNHDDGHRKVYDMAYDVVAESDEVYRFYVRWYIEDSNAKNVGIWSIYVLKYEDDPAPCYRYWGDGKITTGINVGKTYDMAQSCFNEAIEYFDSRDYALIKRVFAYNLQRQYADFDSELERLLGYYQGEYVSAVRKDYELEYSDENDIIKVNIKMTYEVTTTTGIYEMAMFWCRRDTTDSGNNGIHSMYILSVDSSTSEPYWGDGLWTEGINIGVEQGD